LYLENYGVNIINLKDDIVKKYLCGASPQDNERIVCKKSKGHEDSHCGCDIETAERVIVKWED
jgi:hypothetical protein